MAYKEVYNRTGQSNSVTKSQERKTIKFTTREGEYVNVADQTYSRPNKSPFYYRYSIPVRLSLGLDDFILYNIGADLFCHSRVKLGQKVNVNQPVDKYSNKNGHYPICHDVNEIMVSQNVLPVVVGYENGMLVCYNPLKSKPFATVNHSNVIDGTAALDVKWQPGEKYVFVSAHRSGNLYFWNIENNTSATLPPSSVSSVDIEDAKIKLGVKNHLRQKWQVGHGSINAIDFSSDGNYLALACQDGFMRVYNAVKHEFHGKIRSYFGSFLCVCWSVDRKYIAAGGEDDLVTVYSVDDNCVVTRCEGHGSWVNAVSFDQELCPKRSSGSSHASHSRKQSNKLQDMDNAKKLSSTSLVSDLVHGPIYRLVSVGQDGCLALWDLTADSLKIRRPYSRSRLQRSHGTQSESSDVSSVMAISGRGNNSATQEKDSDTLLSKPESQGSTQIKEDNCFELRDLGKEDTGITNTVSQSSQKENSQICQNSTSDFPENSKDAKSLQCTATKAKRTSSYTEKEDLGKDRKPFKKFVKKMRKVSLKHQVSTGPPYLGDAWQSGDTAPSMHEINLIQPLVLYEASTERLTDLKLTTNAIIVASQHGFVQVWSRPCNEDSNLKRI